MRTQRIVAAALLLLFFGLLLTLSFPPVSAAPTTPPQMQPQNLDMSRAMAPRRMWGFSFNAPASTTGTVAMQAVRTSSTGYVPQLWKWNSVAEVSCTSRSTATGSSDYAVACWSQVYNPKTIMGIAGGHAGAGGTGTLNDPAVSTGIFYPAPCVVIRAGDVGKYLVNSYETWMAADAAPTRRTAACTGTGTAASDVGGAPCLYTSGLDSGSNVTKPPCVSTSACSTSGTPQGAYLVLAASSTSVNCTVSWVR